MKKFVLSSVFVFLMMFSLPLQARAEEYCALGSHSAGTELNCYIATLAADAALSAQGLPEGLYIAETPNGDTKQLDLKGVAMTAGHLDFSVTVSQAPELISCSIDILPASPAIVSGGDKSCKVGEEAILEISASVADSGSLSYQWYAAASAEPAAAIAGANAPSYKPDSSIPGNFFYCCQVTNLNNGLSSTALSPAIHLSVTEPILTGIEINTLPRKLSYAPGDSLDAAGLSLRLVFDDGSIRTIEDGFEASPAVFTEPGKQLVELRYENFVCSYQVEVSLSEADIEGIGVLTLPDKSEYEIGDSLETEGLSLRVYTAKGHFDVSEGFKCLPTVFRSSGRQSITVEYEGKRCSFTVTVKDDNTVKSIGIASLPTRREYAVGDMLDTKGLSLQLIYGGRTEIVSTGFDCTPKQLTKEGAQEITVSYMGHSANFTINVKAASESPVPTATAIPSATPTAENPAESRAPAINRDHQAKELGGLVKLIFFMAVASLAALAGYVVYMQKKGKR